ncbi:MAG: 16S rRNA (uracil(1498)-N(3))-methyltransferase [Treponema sp.]|jgi:16S rRNA U1498 N3-methylase RsmE|nr:16S rRNA (uracil(1498)-N(3))-methyltransferase [Treponema sp.]
MVNIILFENHEIGSPLPRGDARTVHLLKVLHKNVGDTFDAGMIGSSLGTGRIEAVGPEGTLVFSLDLHESPPPRLPLGMAIGFPRPIQLRRLLRDLATLGVATIDLIGTELGEKSYRDTTLLTSGGARQALIEGAIQARDTILPCLSVYQRLEAWLRERPWERFWESMDKPDGKPALRPSPCLIAADNVRPWGSLARLDGLKGPLVIAIGSERGWSDRERDKLEGAGFLRLSMGSRALRTETAGVAAAILAMEKIGALD